jgi:hypothetical protein
MGSAPFTDVEPCVFELPKINRAFRINILQKRFRIANFSLRNDYSQIIAICILLILFAVVSRLIVTHVLGLDKRYK